MQTLAIITSNLKGPSSQKRKVLYSSMHNTIMYAAPSWGEIVRIAKYRNELIGIQMKGLLSIVSANRTVSAKALQTITVEMPIDPRIEDIMGSRNVNGNESLDRWQEK